MAGVRNSLETTMTGLRVEFDPAGLSLDTASGCYEWVDSGWLVLHGHGNDLWALRELFARKQDAEAAMRAISSVIDWDGSEEEVDARIREYGRERINRLMMEAMQW